MSEREHHIKALENLLSHYKSREKCEGYYDRTLKDNVEALQYAISSLKTDLKYDLMYEGEDVCTKADMVAMLKEVDLQFDKICFYKNMGEWKTVPEIKAEYKAIIQQKINALKGE